MIGMASTKEMIVHVTLVASAVQFLAKPSLFLPYSQHYSLLKYLNGPDEAVFVLATTMTDGQPITLPFVHA